MPDLARITSTFFVTLINRLGVRPPPADGFLLSNVVQPVSLVDSDIVLSAVVGTQTLDAGNSAGEQVNPASGTVLADTGAVTLAGVYSIQFEVGWRDANNSTIIIQRRDAANATSIWEQRYYNWASLAMPPRTISFRVALAASERVRIVTGEASNVLSKYFAAIWIQQVS